MFIFFFIIIWSKHKVLRAYVLYIFMLMQIIKPKRKAEDKGSGWAVALSKTDTVNIVTVHVQQCWMMTINSIVRTHSFKSIFFFQPSYINYILY